MTSKRSVHFANEEEEEVECTKKLANNLTDLHEKLAIARNRIRQIEREQ